VEVTDFQEVGGLTVAKLSSARGQRPGSSLQGKPFPLG